MDSIVRIIQDSVSHLEHGVALVLDMCGDGARSCLWARARILKLGSYR